MSADVTGLIAYVDAHPDAVGRITLRNPRGVVRGRLVVHRTTGGFGGRPKQVVRIEPCALSDRVIAEGRLELRVGRRYVDARRVLACDD